MHLFGIDLTERPVLIAEIGVNHEGDVDKAVELLHLAAEAGADAVKFQSYTPERFIGAADADRLARVTRFGLDEAAHLRLKAEAVRRGVAFFSSAISEDWVPFLAQHCAAIKIASGDVDFEPVIRAAAASGLPVILSTGTATLDETRQAIDWAVSEMGTEGAAAHLAVLHCVSAYPTPLDQANLLAIPTLIQAFPDITIGYSNHVIGPEAPIAAVALGARIVEVHFTDQKEGRTFRDHTLSCDPADLAYLARILPQVAASRGDGIKRPQLCEEGTGPAIRKGLVAARDLPVGHVIAEGDIQFARPATEFPASAYKDVLGKSVKDAVGKGHSLRRAAVSG
ncbi:MAG: N-acetylneuraminate synthase family protein [Alphaproteobacteria bacterium]|nr:N-acetylneuraminate synthase family protein [Alphaproteobacteria bacterium]